MVRLLRLVCAACVLLALLGAARAATVEVAPVLHELAADRRATSLTVTNRGPVGVTLQVRGFGWAQSDEGERLEPAPQLMFSPAIFAIEPGRSQVVRVLLPANDGTSERSWRLLIDEIPDAQAGTPLRFALRLSVPIFQAAAQPEPALLSARVDAASGQLLLTNRGGTHERIPELALVDAHGQRFPAAAQGLPYLLPGATRRWKLAEGAQPVLVGEPLWLEAETRRGRVRVALAAP